MRNERTVNKDAANVAHCNRPQSGPQSAHGRIRRPRLGRPGRVRGVVATGLLLVIVVVAPALVFDFTNGFHDSANAMATSIATGAMRPRVAVGLGAVLNVAGAFLSTA